MCFYTLISTTELPMKNPIAKAIGLFYQKILTINPFVKSVKMTLT